MNNLTINEHIVNAHKQKIANDVIILEQPDFNIKDWHYFGSISYKNKVSVVYLFIIHKYGILKYNLKTQIIDQEYVPPVPIETEYMIRNNCCLDASRNIIFMHFYQSKRIVTFNIETRQWNFNFHQSNLYMSELVYIHDPIDEVQISCVDINYTSKTIETYKIMKDGKKENQLLNIQQMNDNIYSPIRIDSHLYILKATLKTNLIENLNIVIR